MMYTGDINKLIKNGIGLAVYNVLLWVYYITRAISLGFFNHSSFLTGIKISSAQIKINFRFLKTSKSNNLQK